MEYNDIINGKNKLISLLNDNNIVVARNVYPPMLWKEFKDAFYARYENGKYGFDHYYNNSEKVSINNIDDWEKHFVEQELENDVILPSDTFVGIMPDFKKILDLFKQIEKEN